MRLRACISNVDGVRQLGLPRAEVFVESAHAHHRRRTDSQRYTPIRVTEVELSFEHIET
jgi:hypothetical protein